LKLKQSFCCHKVQQIINYIDMLFGSPVALMVMEGCC